MTLATHSAAAMRALARAEQRRADDRTADRVARVVSGVDGPDALDVAELLHSAAAVLAGALALHLDPTWPGAPEDARWIYAVNEVAREFAKGDDER